MLISERGIGKVVDVEREGMIGGSVVLLKELVEEDRESTVVKVGELEEDRDFDGDVWIWEPLEGGFGSGLRPYAAGIVAADGRVPPGVAESAESG